ncbi:MAG: hypothetical protein AAFO62_11950 [Pseudomonadota bacterium]
MKTAPFSVTPILMTTLLAGGVAGAIVGAILDAMSLTAWPWAILCGVLPGFVVNPLRASMEDSLAEIAGAKPGRFAVSWQGCIGLAIVASLLAAYAVVVLGALPVGLISGAMIGLISGIIIALVMTVRRTAG